MGPNTAMNSNSEFSTLTVPKLCDDGSNWSDYQLRLQNAMGAKGLWRHVEGTAVVPVMYSEQQNRSSVGHFHKDCFVVLETLGLNL